MADNRQTAPPHPATAPPATKKRGQRRPIDPNETPDRKFRRLANQRVNASIKRIRYVASLANKKQYMYTSEQAAKIIAALALEVEAVRRAFAGQTEEKKAFEV